MQKLLSKVGGEGILEMSRRQESILDVKYVLVSLDSRLRGNDGGGRFVEEAPWRPAWHRTD